MSAFFGVGMNNTVTVPLSHEYLSWKGKGLFQNPSAKTFGNIRPLTNNDYSNGVRQRFGLPRPLKWQHRRGITTPNPVDSIAMPSRQVKSTVGSELLRETQDNPGLFNVYQNTSLSVLFAKHKNEGINLTTSYSPNPYLTNNPREVCTQKSNCCNQPKNALRRVRGPSTLLKPNYYTTLQQYRQARCQTYQQKQFNFYFENDVDGIAGNPLAKPGSPESLDNMYHGGCYPSTCVDKETRGCQSVIYKPSNYQFAKQGAVDSSWRTFAKAVETAETNAYTDTLQRPYFINTPFMLKAKTPKCKDNCIK